MSIGISGVSQMETCTQYEAQKLKNVDTAVRIEVSLVFALMR